jgi:arabinose-5-phosphate isomerase
MHGGAQLPLVTQETSMHDAVVEMSVKRLGIVGVTDNSGQLVGVITDGDLRRHIEEGLDHPASDFMTTNPKTIGPETLVDEALTMFDEHRITTLFVVDGRIPVGVLHIHDCPASR